MTNNAVEKYSKLQLWKLTGELRGIAILGVLISHASCFSILLYRLWISSPPIIFFNGFNLWKCVMPFWTFVHEFSRFSVPLFLFLSGVHMAKFNKSWRSVWSMTKKVLIPLLVWSLFRWAYEAVIHENYWAPGKFLLLTLKGETQLGFFYIPLIIQYYILSIWLVDLVKKYPGGSLAGASLVQGIFILNNYLAQFSLSGIVKLPIPMMILPDFLFPGFIFFFVLGIWAGQDMVSFRELFVRYGKYITPLLLLSMVFIMAEHGFLFGLTNFQEDETLQSNLFRALAPWKISSNLFSLFAVFWLVGKKYLIGKKSNILGRLGAVSFSIYVLHGAIFTFFLDVQYKIAPKSFLIYVFFIIVIGSAALIPLLLEKWAGKKYPVICSLTGLS